MVSYGTEIQWKNISCSHTIIHPLVDAGSLWPKIFALNSLLALAYHGKDIEFRFIIEYSKLKGILAPR
jgi:hypothetical protein